MTARYPTQLPNLPTLAALSQPGTTFADVDLAGDAMREWMGAVADELLAIATKIGIVGSTDVNSIVYQLAHVITNDVPRAQVYNSSTGTWGDPTSRPKIFVAQASDPEPTRDTNDMIFRKRVE